MTASRIKPSPRGDNPARNTKRPAERRRHSRRQPNAVRISGPEPGAIERLLDAEELAGLDKVRELCGVRVGTAWPPISLLIALEEYEDAVRAAVAWYQSWRERRRKGLA
jgi:hypothetical protein